MDKAKILIIVEGSRADTRLMRHLFEIYQIEAKYEIIPYNTNIYVLYNQMFYDGKPEDMDILQVLNEHEPNEKKKQILEQKFNEILLIFDLDPQDPQFTADKITAMMEYFVESTDMGKLYLNYPMLEAFYHMSAIPDPDYYSRVATLVELRGSTGTTYKQRVNAENRNSDYLKFAATRGECNILIRQNITKGWNIIGANPDTLLPDSALILDKQLEMLYDYGKIYVLCTCVFFIAEYNPKLLDREGELQWT